MTPTAAPTDDAPRLFCFGLGYSARALVARLRTEEGLRLRQSGASWSFAGTSRDQAGLQAIVDMGADAFVFNRDTGLPADALAGASHVLVSIPPDEVGDVTADRCGGALAALPGLRWVGVLSTTGVYGATGGATVDEAAPLAPTSNRAHRRVAAEESWLALHHGHGVPVHIFRLPGIYGPGRSALDRVRANRAPLIEKPGHMFSRIHVDDIANVLAASMAKPNPGAIYNVADDEAAEPAAVTRLAYELLGRAPPAPVAFADAVKDMSPLQRSFWADNRQVSNARIKNELGVTLLYPTYREGLPAVRAVEEKAAVLAAET